MGNTQTELTKRYSLWVFLAALLFFAFICRQDFDTPPVWDAAAGVFAPAAYLYEGHGSLIQLLSEKGYPDGGPNVHTLSVITAINYLSMLASKGNPHFYLPALHFLNIVMGAFIIVVVFRLATPLFGRNGAVACCFPLACYPLFLVQTSYVYTEVPGALFSLLAIYYWTRRHYWPSALFTVAALSIKSLGLFVVASCLALLILDMSTNRNRNRLIWPFLFITISSGLIEGTRWHFSTTPAFLRDSYQSYLISLLSYLAHVPDLLLVTLFSPVCLWVLMREAGSLYKLSDQKNRRVQTATVTMTCAFVSMMLTMPLSAKNFFPLPRYYVWTLPALFVCVQYTLYHMISAITHKHGPAVSLAGTAMTALFFLLNQNGRFYPVSDASNASFSATERSFEYRNFLAVQQSAIDYLDHQKPLPVYCTRGIFYYLSSPLMGYSKSPNMARLVLKEPGRGRHWQDLPGRYYIIDSGSENFHGEDIVSAMLQRANNDKLVRVIKMHDAKSGPYHSAVYLVEATFPASGHIKENSIVPSLVSQESDRNTGESG
ncbi:MAG: glycosyltransferase family 39 protein [Alcanivorax sp.]|nr:glycosyltransferase family 39 protein [Alcanivorax sp.]